MIWVRLLYALVAESANRLLLPNYISFNDISDETNVSFRDYYSQSATTETGALGPVRSDFEYMRVEQVKQRFPVCRRRAQQFALRIGHGLRPQGWLVAQAMLMDVGDLRHLAGKADPEALIVGAGTQEPARGEPPEHGFALEAAPAAQAAAARVAMRLRDGEPFDHLVELE